MECNVFVRSFSVEKPNDDDHCRSTSHLSLYKSNGYISARTAMDTGAGFLTCPWQLNGQYGQRINVSIINFHQFKETGLCTPIAYITDMATKENQTICTPTERNQHVYLSDSNTVQIQLYTTPPAAHGIESFLLHYEGEEIICPFSNKH